jgi:transposase
MGVDPAAGLQPLLIIRRTLREQIVILHRRLLAIVRDDEVCRRLMTTPGVGPVVALTYRATVDPHTANRSDKELAERQTARLEDRVVKVQTTLVVSPRNHRYLRARSAGTGAPVCEVIVGVWLATGV